MRKIRTAVFAGVAALAAAGTALAAPAETRVMLAAGRNRKLSLRSGQQRSGNLQPQRRGHFARVRTEAQGRVEELRRLRGHVVGPDRRRDRGRDRTPGAIHDLEPPGARSGASRAAPPLGFCSLLRRKKWNMRRRKRVLFYPPLTGLPNRAAQFLETRNLARRANLEACSHDLYRRRASFPAPHHRCAEGYLL